jgi:hypothetical protein
LLVALIATYLVVLGADLTKRVSLTELRRKSKEFSERQTRQGRIGVLEHSAKEGRRISDGDDENQLYSESRKKIPQCSRCQLSLDEHLYADLGSAPMGSIEESELNEAVRNRQWADAARFQAANAMSDIRV